MKLVKCFPEPCPDGMFGVGGGNSARWGCAGLPLPLAHSAGTAETCQEGESEPSFWV